MKNWRTHIVGILTLGLLAYSGTANAFNFKVCGTYQDMFDTMCLDIPCDPTGCHTTLWENLNVCNDGIGNCEIGPNKAVTFTQYDGYCTMMIGGCTCGISLPPIFGAKFLPGC